VRAVALYLLQNITYVINPRGATVFPKGHTSWDTPLHLYISVMICGMQTTVLSFVSLNLITTEYTLTRYQHLCSRLSGCQISSSLPDEDKTMENTNLFSSSHGLNTANCATTAKSNNNKKVLCIWFFFKLTATHITTGAGRRPSRPRCCEHRPTQASHSAGGCTTIWRGQAWLQLLRVSRPRTAMESTAPLRHAQGAPAMARARHRPRHE
jgi:hypothetical protein